MLKKMLTLATVASLATTVAACGGTTDKASTTTPSASSPTPTATEGPKPVLRELLYFARFDPNTDPVAKFLKEKTGYEVKYDLLPAENADDKLNLLMANKEPYDFMKLQPAQFAKLVAAGALEPLDEYLNKYGANLKNAISPESWNAAKVNGKIYGIPESGSGVIVNQLLAVRQDWMDELGLKAPTNADELYNVLKTIKEKKNVIPLTIWKTTGVMDIMDTLGGMFGITTDWKNQGGKLVHQVEDPNMKEFLNYMAKLYKEGLIDSEWGLNTVDKSIEKVVSGKAAMMPIPYYLAPNVINPLTKNFPTAKLTVLPVLKDKNGKAEVKAIGTSVGWFIGVPKFSANKEHTIKYLDLKMKPDIFKESAIGIEGVHHTFKDGNYAPILPKFNDDYANGSNYMTGVDEKNYPNYWKARVRKDENVAKIFESIQANSKGIMVTDPLAAAPPIDAIAKNTQKLTKLTGDTFVKYISGAEPVSNYDNYLKQWKADGGDEMVKAANEWYAANKK